MSRPAKNIVIVLLMMAVVLCTATLTACNLLGGSGEYTVTFVADGITVATCTYTEKDNSVGEPPVPAKKGYNGVWENYTLRQQKNITVNAVYTAKTYEVYFDYDGGTAVDPSMTLTVTYDQPIGELPTTTKNGYTFVGWYYGNNLITTGSSWNIDDDNQIRLVAKWYKPTTYTVRFYADGKYVAERVYNTDDLTLDEPQVPTKYGYDGAWEEYTLTHATGNFDVNAVYTAKIFNVELNYDGATDGKEQQSITVTFDERIGELPTPRKDGYKFLGWYIDDTKMSANFTKWQWDSENLMLTAMWWDRSLGSQGMKFELNADNSSYTVTGISYQSNDDTDLDIPSLHDGLPVTAIKVSAFWQDSQVKAVYIGNNVTEIGGSAFYGCAKLESVTLGSGVQKIGSGAFGYCYKISNVYFAGDLESWCAINFGGSDASPVKSGASFYIDRQLITDVVIPNSITAIGNYVFSGCGKITSVTLHSNVTSIGRSAFKDCVGLTDVVLSQGIKTIGASAFENCRQLTSVDIPQGVTSIGDSTFSSCINLTSVTIPNTISEISPFAFYLCSELTSVVIPQGVTQISNSAFESCGKLASVTIPQGVTSIGDSAFGWCRELTAVAIPDSVTEIGKKAFLNCSKLADVTVGCGVTKIGDQAFYNCSSISKVTYTGNATDWCSISLVASTSNPLNSGAELYLNGALATKIEISNDITAVNNYVFYGCVSLTEVNIASGVTSIGDYAFYGCRGIERVTLPADLQELGIYCFVYCSGLLEIAIPDSLEIIPEYAFAECSNLETLTIALGVTTIGKRAFYGCEALQAVAIPNSVTEMGERAFYGCNSLTNLSIGSGLEVIADYAFYGNDLENLTLPDKVTAIGAYAFANGASLTTVSMSNGILSVDRYAFDGCDSLTYTEEYNARYLGNSSNPYVVLVSVIDKDKTCAINKQTRIIADYAFYECSWIFSVAISTNLVAIGNYAFADCTRLETINYGGTAEQWNAVIKGDNWLTGAGKFTIVYEN